MARFETGTVVRLGSREAITLVDIRGATLRVTRGALWMTQQRDRQDIVLRVGDSWAVERDGDTVVEALGDTAFCMVAPYGAAPIRLPARAARVSRFLDGILAWLHPPQRNDVPYF